MPTNAYSLYTKLNIKNFEAGYSYLFESHSSGVGTGADIYLRAKDLVYDNSLQNAYLTHNFTSKNEKFTLNSTLSGQQFKILPRSVFVNQYSGYKKGYKYSKDNVVKIEEQFNYTLLEKLNLVGGLSYEYINAIPKTSDLPYQYDENKSPQDQNIYYPGTNVTDSAGNDLTIIQDIYDIKYSNAGSYLQLQYYILKNLTLTAGTRYDYNTRYKGTINPRVGLVFKPIKALSVKLLYGQAYLAPSPYKSYQHYGSFFPISNSQGEISQLGSAYWYLPNFDLKPEKRTSYDASAMYQLNTNFAFSVNGYYAQISNLIVAEGYINEIFHDIPVGFVNKNINKGEAINYGGTARIDYKGVLGLKFKTNFFAAYSYVDGNIANAPLIYSAKHTVKSGLSVMYNQRLQIYTKVQYRSGSLREGSTFEKPLISDAFTVINLTANYKILNKPKFQLGVFSSISNVLNTKYYNAGNENLDQSPQDPLRANFGLKLDLK